MIFHSSVRVGNYKKHEKFYLDITKILMVRTKKNSQL